MKLTIRKKSHSSNHGFTLLETLVSAAILAVVIVGPLAVLTSSSVYAKQTKDVIAASFLAEEAVELLQNQYDSVYLFCTKNPEDLMCQTSSETETLGQVSWRVFKERVGSRSSSLSCFNSTTGCLYDPITMMAGVTTTPTLLDPSQCRYLVNMATTTVSYFAEQYYISPGGYVSGGQGGGEHEGMTSTTTYVTREAVRNVYVCNGVSDHIPGGAATSSAKMYTRSVFVESVPTTVEENSVPQGDRYNDDLRIVSTINFRGVNGVLRTVKVTRYMHALP